MWEGSGHPVRVGVFVDWNSQLRTVKSPPPLTHEERARQALKRLGSRVTRVLTAEPGPQDRRFRVELRLYSGWTKGFTRSDYFRALAGLREAFDLDTLFPSSRVNVLGDIGFGDRLLDCGMARENSGLGIHLPNTLRQQSGDARWQEKMVDTALACDLLSWVRATPDGWVVVVSNDDDLIPPVFVAEAWLQHSAGRVLLIRQSRPGERFLQLDGLVRNE